MVPKIRLPLALALMVSVASANDELAEAPPTIKELIAQIRTELREEMRGEDGRRGERSWQLSTMLLQIERAFRGEGNEYGGDLTQSLALLESMATTEKLQSLTQALSTEAGRELGLREKATVRQIEANIDANVKPALAATKAADIDAPLAALQEITQESRSGNASRGVQRAREQARQAAQFLAQWQDYLSAKEAGRSDQARTALSNLTNSGRDYNFIPRSKLLALQNEMAPREQRTEALRRTVSEIVAEIKTIEDLEKSAEAVMMARVTSDVDGRLREAVLSLTHAYCSVKDGLPAILRLNEPGSGNMLVPLRNQVVAMGLPRMLLLDEGNTENVGETPPEAAVRAGESIPDYLRRRLKEAQTKEDWPQVARVLTVTRTLNLLDTVAASQDANALALFCAGMNQKKAKQFSFAVSSFLRALNEGSNIVPAELIGGHLEEIRSAAPTEFEKGVERAVVLMQAAANSAVRTSAVPRLSLTGNPSASFAGPDGRAMSDADAPIYVPGKGPAKEGATPTPAPQPKATEAPRP